MMPLLTGLVGGSAEGGPSGGDESMLLTLDDLTADELEALQVEAETALASGVLDGVGEEEVESGEVEEDEGAMGCKGPVEGEETAADEAAETPEEQAAEDEAGTELHSTTDFVEQTQAGYEACSALVDELKAAVKELDEDNGATDLLETAETDCDEAKEIADSADDAIDDDDIQAAAEAAARVDVIKQSISDALAQVAALKQAEADAKAAAEAPKDAPPPVAAPKRGLNEHPLSMWAKRAVGGVR